jgi:tetratricopeptide (TPR) repeat protein
MKPKKRKYLALLKFIPAIVIIVLVLHILLLLFTGCKYGQSSAAVTREVQSETSQEPAEESVSSQESPETAAETETTEEIPEEILSLIKEADGYYGSGEYAMAKTIYRKAEIAIKDSLLSEETGQALIDTFYGKYTESRDIVETARTHYGNAMQLQYETNYEQALAELEEALKIYPKYAEAQEAYDNLKTLMGLS